MFEWNGTACLMQLMPQAAVAVKVDSGQIILHNEPAALDFGLEMGSTTEKIGAMMCHVPSMAGLCSVVKAELASQGTSVIHHMEMHTPKGELRHYDIHISYVDETKKAVFLIFSPSVHDLARMAQQNMYFETLSKAVYSYPFHLDVQARRMTLYDPELEKFNLPLSMDNFPQPVLDSGVLCEDDLEVYLQTVERMYRGEPPQGAFRCYDPQGELLTYTVNYVVNRDVEGRPIEVTGDFVIQSEMKFDLPQQKVMLSHQIKAHFFFNTLNTISALCKQDAAKADSAIRTFATYMRSYMHLINEQENIPFAQEITLVKSTLEIEKIRFPDSFVYELELEELEFQIPPLTLQPLVENALLHGLRRTGYHGTLKISSKRVGASIQVVVSDNGLGFDTADLEKPKSVGLKNLTKRIAMMVGGTVTIESQVGKGTQSILEIPVVKCPAVVDRGGMTLANHLCG